MWTNAVVFKAFLPSCSHQSPYVPINTQKTMHHTITRGMHNIVGWAWARYTLLMDTPEMRTPIRGPRVLILEGVQCRQSLQAHNLHYTTWMYGTQTSEYSHDIKIHTHAQHRDWLNRLRETHMVLYMLHTDPAYHVLSRWLYTWTGESTLVTAHKWLGGP